jgi:hypothetical protein
MPTRIANPVLEMEIMRLLRNTFSVGSPAPEIRAMLFIFIAAMSEVKLWHPQRVWCLLAVRPG